MNRKDFPDFCLCGNEIKSLNNSDFYFSNGDWICFGNDNCWWIWDPIDKIFVELGRNRKTTLDEWKRIVKLKVFE